MWKQQWILAEREAEVKICSRKLGRFMTTSVGVTVRLMEYDWLSYELNRELYIRGQLE